MKRSADFYKVVNAVLNTLRQGGSVPYYMVANSSEGGAYTPEDDFRELRLSLLDYTNADDDEDVTDQNFRSDHPDCDIWTLFRGNNFICLAIDPDNYITSSYDLRDMICDDYELEAAEITEGMNGYPRGLRGCVLLSGCGKTIDEMKELADLYGVELVSLHRRDGWQLWESQGWTWDLYDVEDFMDEHNDNLHRWDSYKEYAEELREYANGGNMDEDMKQEFLEAAEKADGMELGENEFLYCEQGFPYLTDPDKADRMVDHFSYDTHNYSLALDCMVTD